MELKVMELSASQSELINNLEARYQSSNRTQQENGAEIQNKSDNQSAAELFF